jgi:hypothetical protein
MKRTINAILLVSCALAFAMFVFFFARMRRENYEASLPVTKRVLDFSMADTSDPGSEAKPPATLRTKIPPEYNEIFLDTMDINLDDDEDLEQVIVSKPFRSESNEISIIIVDFQPATGNYYRYWKGKTAATKANAFILQPMDILKDGSIELLCHGIDNVTNQTLSIFRRSSGGNDFYTTIFSESGLGIAIVNQDSQSRSPAEIDLYLSDPSSTFPLDRIRRRYVWNSEKREYRASEDQAIPGANMEKAFIDTIVTGIVGDFESYLEGLWVKEGMEASSKVLLSFSPKTREVSIHSERAQQHWDWGESTQAYSGLRASISNSSVADMMRLISVELIGVDRIKVNAFTQQFLQFPVPEDWNGTYRRFAAPEAKNTFPVHIEILDSKKWAIEGSYRSEDSFFLNLNNGTYDLLIANIREKGAYSLFQMGDSLVLDLLEDLGASNPRNRRTYIVEMTKPMEGQAVKMILKPAVILADRVAPLYRPDIALHGNADQGRR